MTDANELLRAVYADPLSDGPRLVYSDYLLERGDRLGEFIALQIARKTKGKKTASREKTLFAAEGASWFKDHPCAQFGTLRWEDTERGFPSRFRPGWPVSEEYALEQERAVAAILDNAGWNTVTSLYLHFDASSEALARLLRADVWRSLREIDGLNVAILDRIADAPLSVTDVELWVRTERDLPAVTGFPRWKRLVLDIRTSVPRAMRALEPSGLLARLNELELRGVHDIDYRELIAIHAGLPATLSTLRVNRFYGQSVTLTGDRTRPELTVSMTAHEIDSVLEALTALDEAAVQKVEVTFADGGFFTKKNRPVLAERVKNALAKWGDRATLHSGL